MCKENNLLKNEERKFICDLVLARVGSAAGQVNSGDSIQIARNGKKCWDEIMKLTGDNNHG
jgi:hypothetical protein